MRTLLVISAGAVATAALMVLCNARPWLPPAANSAANESPGVTASGQWGDSDPDTLFACDCTAASQEDFDADCFPWWLLHIGDEGAGDDD